MGNKQEGLEGSAQVKNYELITTTGTQWDQFYDCTAVINDYKVFRSDRQRRGLQSPAVMFTAALAASIHDITHKLPCSGDHQAHGFQLLLFVARLYPLVERHFSCAVDHVTFSDEHALTPLKYFGCVHRFAPITSGALGTPLYDKLYAQYKD
ncbi:hypothetical protein DUI87_18956 [Hirundo rustica rustica]|uniref:Uncharacterized protein n=1 Tax=Hirundo rustica rustica TaxID=333673 RepID=A0A3M0K003_HIRRU|nr:hypothetical protein DUI87_18956 [Hirundo rustica rustica]